MHNVIKDFFNSIFSPTSYLTYGIGNYPIIISAPHGGAIEPLNIPKRTWGNRSRDTYTRRLIELIINGLPVKPYYIYSDIHRNRVDLNREIGEAAQGNKKAQAIWTEWNKTLSEFTKDVSNKYPKGLYIDLHSHNNSNLFEIGYGLSVKDYLDIKSNWKVTRRSYMFAFSENGNEFPPLFGDYSFPRSIENYGYKVLTPVDEKHYLNGGRDIKQFHNEKIGAIQIECPIPILKTDLEKVSKVLIESINRFSNRFLA